MRRSKKVAKIFEELCEVIGEDFEHSELLLAADNIVDSASEHCLMPVADDREYGTPFENWAVDRVLSDGGWRLLSRNDSAQSVCEIEDAKEIRAHRAINRYLEEYR